MYLIWNKFFCTVSADNTATTAATRPVGRNEAVDIMQLYGLSTAPAPTFDDSEDEKAKETLRNKAVNDIYADLQPRAIGYPKKVSRPLPEFIDLTSQITKPKPTDDGEWIVSLLSSDEDSDGFVPASQAPTEQVIRSNRSK